VSDVASGVKTGLNQTGETAMRILGATPGVGDLLHMAPGWQRSQQQTHEIANAPIDTGGKALGYVGENILEFIAGDEALKGLSSAAKISELSRVEQALKKSPVLTRMLGNAVRAQTVGTAQAAMHGASGGQAVLQGTGAAVGGAALEGTLAGASRFLNLIRPSTIDVMGQPMTRLASQTPGAAQISSDVADIGSSTRVAREQQQVAASAIKTRAQQVAARELDKLNAARRTRWMPGEGEMNLAPEAEPLPAERQLPSGQPALPATTTPSGAPQIEAGAQPTGIARTGEVGPYEGAFEEPSTNGQAAPGQAGPAPQRPPQRVSYVEERPANFAPIDSAQEAAGVQSFGDAADKIREHAGPVFDRFDKVTNGEYTNLRALRDEAYANDDYAGVRTAEKGIDSLFDWHNVRGQIDRLDYQSAKSAWKTSKMLDAVHDAVSKSFNLSDESIATDADVWRGINGGRLMTGINRLTKDYTRGELEDVIGKDGLTGLAKIASLTQSPQRAALYGEKVNEAADAVAQGARKAKMPATLNWARNLLLHRIATSPAAASRFNYIFENKIPPAIYRPLLNSLLGLSDAPTGEQQELSDTSAGAGTPAERTLKNVPMMHEHKLNLPADVMTRPLSSDLENRVHDQSTTPPLKNRLKAKAYLAAREVRGGNEEESQQRAAGILGGR
jgi:hypothetical protein